MNEAEQRRIFNQGLLLKKQEELGALEVKSGRLKTELNLLISPYVDPLEDWLATVNVDRIDQATKELRELKALYTAKKKEIAEIKKEL